MAERYIKKVKRPVPKHLGEGEWKIPVTVLHKGLHKESQYSKGELYRMLGDANVAIGELTKDKTALEEEIKAKDTNHDEEMERVEVARALVAERNNSLKKRFMAWRISTVVFALAVLGLVVLYFLK